MSISMTNGKDDASGGGAKGTVRVEDAVRASEEQNLKTRVRDALIPYFKPTRSTIMPGLLRSVVAQPIVFEFWYRARALRYFFTHGMQSFEEKKEGPESFLGKVGSYNKSQLWTWHRGRTEKIMAALRCVNDLPKKPRILVIGPRNEAELLLMHLYGFDLEGITSIDIFSYSPKIELMDMHDIKYPDGTFDVVYSAWTLKYSYDLKKACDEIIRVVKPGGVVAAGFTHTKLVTDVVGAPIAGGLKELLQMFEPHVDWVYWQDAFKTPAGTEEITTVFRVKK
jgi:hypothetical protein